MAITKRVFFKSIYLIARVFIWYQEWILIVLKLIYISTLLYIILIILIAKIIDSYIRKTIFIIKTTEAILKIVTLLQTTDDWEH